MSVLFNGHSYVLKDQSNYPALVRTWQYTSFFFFLPILWEIKTEYTKLQLRYFVLLNFSLFILYVVAVCYSPICNCRQSDISNYLFIWMFIFFRCLKVGFMSCQLSVHFWTQFNHFCFRITFMIKYWLYFLNSSTKRLYFILLLKMFLFVIEVDAACYLFIYCVMF